MQKFIMKKQQQMRERIELGNSELAEPGKEDSRSHQEFSSLEAMINFRTNPYFDNLVRFYYID